MNQNQNQQQPAEAQPMHIEPAHVMSREKHKAREHYERLLQELRAEQQ